METDRSAPDYPKRAGSLSEALASRPSGTFVTVQPADIEYLTGLGSSPGCLLFVPGRRPVLFLDEARWNGAVAQNPYAEMVKVRSGESLASRVIEYCLQQTIETLVCEDLPWGLVEALAGGKRITVIRHPEVLGRLRRKKDAYEQGMLRRAAQLADRCMGIARNCIRAGVTELEVAAEVDRQVKMEGGEGTWFPTVVSSGVRAAHPVYPATRKVIEHGEMVVVDIGPKWNGYCSDITRAFIVGRGNDRAIQIVNVVLEAQDKALASVRKGILAEEVDLAARNVFKQKGFDDYICHAAGHGIGLAKEAPTLAPGIREPLISEECVTIEPGIYVTGFGGARIEDDVLVLDDGAEVLTHFPKDIDSLILP